MNVGKIASAANRTTTYSLTTKCSGAALFLLHCLGPVAGPTRTTLAIMHTDQALKWAKQNSLVLLETLGSRLIRFENDHYRSLFHLTDFSMSAMWPLMSRRWAACVPSKLEAVVAAIQLMRNTDPSRFFQEALMELDRVVADLFGLSQEDLNYITPVVTNDGFLKQLRPNYEHS